jgi:structural maintenance of chromosome 4
LEQQETSEKFKIIREFEKAKLDGFIGRIGDLAKINKKFDIAISASCYANLDVLLFKSARQVDEAIAYLKKNNIG